MIHAIQCSISLKNFDLDNMNMRRAIEDRLKGFFFNIFNVPKGGPQEMPRMIGQTEHGHSILQLSNRFALLMIRFDNDYPKNLEMAFSYARDKLSILLHVLKSLNTKVVSTGIIAQYVFDDIDNPVEKLRENTVRLDFGNATVSNIAVRFAIVHKDYYFLNFELSNIVTNENGKSNIGVTVDINDKYGTERVGKEASLDEAYNIEELHEKLSTEKTILTLLNEGRLDLHEG